MKFMLGANYWGADRGTEMRLHYDGERIRQEMKQLYEYGVRYLHVFPNWRDFQPVEKAYDWRAESGEYIIYREVAKDIINAKPILCDDRNLGITINPKNDNSVIASVLNYSDKDMKPEIKIADGYKISECFTVVSIIFLLVTELL